MNMIRSILQKPASPALIDYVLTFVRIAIGLLAIGHGLPKIMGGPTVWLEYGTPIGLIGIHVFPMFWGLMAGCAETFGGVAFVLGFGTRLAALFMAFAMMVACVLRLTDGSIYHIYSFPLTLLLIYSSFILLGSSKFSLDYYFYRKDKQSGDYHPLMNRPEDYL
jgi:putative oxidoreductase